MTKKRIMLVEDEAITARDFRTNLEELGYEVPVVATRGAEAVRLADEFKPDLILMDITLEGAMTGIEAAGQILLAQQIPIIFLTAHCDSETLAQAKTAEPFGYLTKPCSMDSLKNAIEVALYKSEADARVRESEERYRTLVEKVPVAITVQCGGNFCYCNPAAVRFFGATSESELIGRTILDIVHHDSRAQVWERIATALVTGQPTTAKVDRFIRLDGVEVIAEVVGIPTSYKGKAALQEIYRDITAQKPTELLIAHQ